MLSKAQKSAIQINITGVGGDTTAVYNEDQEEVLDGEIIDG